MKPSSLDICGIAYKVVYSASIGGGETNLDDKIITISTTRPKDILNILFHEIGEAILFERGLRYSRYSDGNDGVRFVLTHHEYENVIADLVTIAKQLKGLKL